MDTAFTILLHLDIYLIVYLFINSALVLHEPVEAVGISLKETDSGKIGNTLNFLTREAVIYH